jgi:hypothetical protein
MTTPIETLRTALSQLQPGQRIQFSNTKEEILKIRENVTRNRSTIPGADNHLEYIEALLVAEAENRLDFKS